MLSIPPARDGRGGAGQGGLMRRGIDAASEARNDEKAGVFQGGGDLASEFEAKRRG